MMQHFEDFFLLQPRLDEVSPRLWRNLDVATFYF